ncbi:hypothetical protein EV142_101794 [Flavobacterium circumlabens]|uniref:Uncharacterized protein n=1 Tax=Flavobacterium circumlabens TaxID=2133765 RepID=A0ABY2B4Z5_9FLAO|nr:hypothetical protein EV142_101794 [Flavobacterium circumlabens]
MITKGTLFLNYKLLINCNLIAISTKFNTHKQQPHTFHLLFEQYLQTDIP